MCRYNFHLCSANFQIKPRFAYLAGLIVVLKTVRCGYTLHYASKLEIDVGRGFKVEAVLGALLETACNESC